MPSRWLQNTSRRSSCYVCLSCILRGQGLSTTTNQLRTVWPAELEWPTKRSIHVVRRVQYQHVHTTHTQDSSSVGAQPVASGVLSGHAPTHPPTARSRSNEASQATDDRVLRASSGTPGVARAGPDVSHQPAQQNKPKQARTVVTKGDEPSIAGRQHASGGGYRTSPLEAARKKSKAEARRARKRAQFQAQARKQVQKGTTKAKSASAASTFQDVTSKQANRKINSPPTKPDETAPEATYKPASKPVLKAASKPTSKPALKPGVPKTKSKSKSMLARESPLPIQEDLRLPMSRDVFRLDVQSVEFQPALVTEQPPVPALSHDLDRVLFNPGVYCMQDPRSRVYNFDPYLEKITPPSNFNFGALQSYVTSSHDARLSAAAQTLGKKYRGSTSSMTGILSHLHFLLSQWRPVDCEGLSKGFRVQLKSFTKITRGPTAIFLRWKDGSYAIDADKQFDTTNVLSMLGQSLEKFLTLPKSKFERYKKSSPESVPEEEVDSPSTYHYSTAGDFLMRAQLDAHDRRLPGTGMFDLKTRAVAAIRMDVRRYEMGMGYEIRHRLGHWESFEREYYDMMRAAFLKYSLQVRMGRMDGIFVAYHNIARIFGFQYISLAEMDSVLHGTWEPFIGDQEFRLSLGLLNKILDAATAKFPERSLRIHLETRDGRAPFTYVFAEPVTEEQIEEIQSSNAAKSREYERQILGLVGAEGVDQDPDDRRSDEGWERLQAQVEEEVAGDDDALEDDTATLVDEATESAADDGALDGGTETSAKESTEGVAEDETSDEDAQALTEDDEEAEEDGEAETVERAVDEDTGKQVSETSANEVTSQASAKDHVIDEVSGDEGILDEQAELSGGEDGVDRPADASGDSDHAHEAATDVSDGDETAGQSAEPPARSIDVQDMPVHGDSAWLEQLGKKHGEMEEIAANRPLLGMTLTIRNLVNDNYVKAPTHLQEGDRWSVEYSLGEIRTPSRTRATYEACKQRRKDLFESEDEEISNYTMNLYRLSDEGKRWREEHERKTAAERPVVLGQSSKTEP